MSDVFLIIANGSRNCFMDFQYISNKNIGKSMKQIKTQWLKNLICIHMDEKKFLFSYIDLLLT